ncbi:MAG TPA: acyl-CoA dehydrogenase family protein [Candidatus Binatia bacterium]|nr:acyl-CoA dehydrogenase family protein [Candidatus Binatia bacterium]
MKFDLSEDQELLRRSTRDLLDREWPLEKSRRLMEHEPRGWDRGAWRQLAEMGYLGLLAPPSAGGQGLGPIELAIVCEEVGRAALPGPYLDAVLAAALLEAAGGHDALLADVVGGRRLAVIARDDAPFSGEPRAVTRFADGRVQGRKYFVPFAASADVLLVATPDGVALAEGPFAATALPTIDLAQRFAEVPLDHPAAFLGPATLLERVDRLAAVGAAAELLGIMARLLDATVGYVQTRQAFGRPIGSFQALQHRLADMLLRTESTRSAVYRAAWCLATDDAEAPLACAAAKAYAGDAARAVAGEAIQMHGGIGFTWELDVHVFFKRAKTLEQHYGATETQLARALAAAGL